jgi:hypothetical protein
MEVRKEMASVRPTRWNLTYKTNERIAKLSTINLHQRSYVYELILYFIDPK